MAQQGRVALKAFFETDDVPTAAQFIDFIDSVLNFADDNYVQTANDYTDLAVAEVAKVVNKADSTTVNDKNYLKTTGDTVGNIKFWSGTQAQYDAIVTKDSETLYITA